MSWLAKKFGFEDAEPEEEGGEGVSAPARGSIFSRWRVVRGRRPAMFGTTPRKLEDAVKAADKLLEGRAVFVNLQHIDSAKAQRIVDILAGVTYALRGTSYEVGKRLFWFVPPYIPAEWDEETVKAVSALFTNVRELSEGDHELPVR